MKVNVQIRTIDEFRGYMRQPGALAVAPAEYALIAEDYRRAAEYHAGRKNFSAAAWYLQLYRLYSPDPEPESQDVELDWSISEVG